MKREEFNAFLNERRDFTNEVNFDAFVNFLCTSDTLTNEQKRKAVDHTKCLWWAVYRNAPQQMIELLVNIGGGEKIFWGVNHRRRNRCDINDECGNNVGDGQSKRRRIQCTGFI